ncbi:Hypothetical protein SynWH7803_1675 [Synechococcus sp. WH 7803]|nr:Hypothetical protein SynWH7803_1675 [Synechococcus sp. WH 7803]
MSEPAVFGNSEIAIIIPASLTNSNLTTPSMADKRRAVLAYSYRGYNKSALQECSQGHGDPKLFQASVTLLPNLAAESSSGSQREADNGQQRYC